MYKQKQLEISFINMTNRLPVSLVCSCNLCLAYTIKQNLMHTFYNH
jgi:hypothetical protein